MPLQAVTALLPDIAKAADDIEQTRRIPAPLIAQLSDAGCLRMMAPAAHGGTNLPMADLLRVIERIASADGSVAWSIGQVALSQLIIGCAAPETIGTVFAAGPDLYAAGAVAPKGRATAEDGGWRVTGQWSFVTGCDHASWLYLNCVLVDGRSIRLDAHGRPVTRILLLPADELTIIDTWYSLGLRGTGSKDVAANGVFCPSEYSVTVDTEAASHAADVIARSSLIIAAVAVGIAAAAVQDVQELAVGGKRPALSAGRLVASPSFHEHLGEAHSLVIAARALVRALADDGADPLGATEPAGARAQLRAGAAQATTLALCAGDLAYGLAGGSAIYDHSPLQRRLRDLHTARQHHVVGNSSFQAFGAALVGYSGDDRPL